MTKAKTKTRDSEARRIAEFNKAVEVSRLMMGQLEAPMRRISEQDFIDLPRKQLRSGKCSVSGSEGDELRAFCSRNFYGETTGKLAALYDRVLEAGGLLRLSLPEFSMLVGKPKKRVLKGAPSHATADISIWGLQFEYPEMHLAKDLTVACNDLVDAERQSSRWVSEDVVRLRRDRREIAELQRRIQYSRRAIVLTCYYLIEAYFNGLAWEYSQSVDDASLSAKERKLLDTHRTPTVEKARKYPPIVAGRRGDWVGEVSSPLETLAEVVKPFRDSIVHASPFSAPEEFGGYDKLSNIYDLTTATAFEAVDASIELLAKCERYLSRPSPPVWLLHRSEDGRYIVT